MELARDVDTCPPSTSARRRDGRTFPVQTEPDEDQVLGDACDRIESVAEVVQRKDESQKAVGVSGSASGNAGHVPEHSNPHEPRKVGEHRTQGEDEDVIGDESEGEARKHEACRAREHCKRLVPRPGVVVGDAVDSERERDPKDRDAQCVQPCMPLACVEGRSKRTIGQTCRVHAPAVLKDRSNLVERVPERVQEEPPFAPGERRDGEVLMAILAVEHHCEEGNEQDDEREQLDDGSIFR